MQKVIWKVFFDYEKEEAWVNDMASKGLSLVGYSPLRYVFEKTEAMKYQYRIELLSKLPSHPESETYLEFLEDNGVKMVASSFRWIFLRKAGDGIEFDLNSSLKTKMNHYLLVMKMLVPIWLLNIFSIIVNLVQFLIYFEPISVFALSVNSTVAVLLGVSIIKYMFKYRHLKKDAMVYDQ